MSYEYDSAVRAPETVPEDSIKGIQGLWEQVAAFNNIISEQIIDAQSNHLGAADMLMRMREALGRVSGFLISTDQTLYYDCKLPYQPSHSFSIGYVCQTDPEHKFCHLHSLRKCVICGGELA